jgi:acyl dehydratase
MSAFERIAIGEIHALGSHAFTTAEIRRFASAYDPQYFHLDEDAATDSLFGGLCASGWHTASVMMRVLVGYFAAEARAVEARGEAAAQLGPSPGFDDLKWTRPVFPGDTIAFAGRVAEKRQSRSRPDWAILSMEVTGTNQNGEPVFSVMTRVFMAVADGN